VEELGTGVLDWDRWERISDRYGSVKLFDPHRTEIRLNPVKELLHGRLIAVVKETRDSTHIGDLFYDVYPSRPQVGEQVILGEGTLFFEGNCVGLVPDDLRETLWLGLEELYRVHQQTVTLFFEESPEIDP